MKKEGISHVELLVVMSVIGVLFVSLGFEYYDWGKRFTAEKIIKELYSDIMYARMRAMTRWREHYIVLSERSYSVVEDTNENGDRDAGDKTLPDYPKRLEQPIQWNNTGNSLTFDKKGRMPTWRTIHVAPTDADYSCISISATRVVMGQYIDDKCNPK